MNRLRGPSGWRRAAALGLAVVVVMGLGVALSAIGGDAPVQTAPPADATASQAARTADAGVSDVATSGPGPADVSGPVGVGFSRDEAGAVAAAVTYATAPQAWLYLSDDAIAESVGAVVVPDAREQLAADVLQEVGPLRDQLAEATGTVWFVVSPLATRIEAYAADRAVVRVWVVRVLSADGVAVPQSGWQTLTLNLRWHAGDWKIAAAEEVDGPTPQVEVGLQPWAADYMAEQLQGFSRVGAAL